ncbi:MAG TPA: TonB family protein [Nitrospira sp.]|nr:TonB family protein [Nitrospira sp.]
MDKVLMTPSWSSNQAVKGWGTSLFLHACLALAAFVLLPKMAMVVQDEPFKWDVALVEPPREVTPPEEPAPTPKAQPSPPVKPQPVRAVPPPPQPQQRQVETRIAPQPIERAPQPVMEAVRPQPQSQPPQEVVQMQPKQLEPHEIQKSEPIVQAAAPAEVKRDVAPAVEQTVMESTSVAAQIYEAQPVVTAPPAVETTPEPVMSAAAPVIQAKPAAEPTPVDPAPAPTTQSAALSEPEAAPSTPSTEPVASPTDAVVAAPSSQATTKEQQVVANAAISKTDNRWLGDSLHRRISELKKYPSMARMNGWEGKVVLKVSIRKDGELKDVQVVTSSGHASLDQAAMEAVRRACPLHMQHELTAPMVVLHVPVSYRLNH